MEIKPEQKKKSDVIGMIEKIALIIVFAFAIYLISTNSDWIMKKYRYVVLSLTTDGSEAGYEVVQGSIEGQILNLLVADTEEKWQKGLSGKEIIGAKQGMLFVFPDLDRHGIWMKDMLFSIDIMWLDHDLKVVQIMTNVSPETFPQVFEPDVQDKYILEVRAGFVERNNIEVGSQLILYD